ncbi:hypothetical protein FEM48_Zijuj11G0163100 [Ziziphus jujuba var. spinosa]|uniref:NADH dehydrogenase [ubiquinone] 1 alpha subcomplex subunit 1 n=1 Tax=Ziziphus jujuba var. spinosa TaxID=714518 RepID=A0A978UJZ7_ZIZJJ|nr:hypothetical protein FEM48_Zijuj11G0163100 [Ziziphus jujuba var. spinosa]
MQNIKLCKIMEVPDKLRRRMAIDNDVANAGLAGVVKTAQLQTPYYVVPLAPQKITVLPLGIIAGMLCVMGNAQYYIHKAAHGRPKHIGNDLWDVAMERRDKKLLEKLSPST